MAKRKLAMSISISAAPLCLLRANEVFMFTHFTGFDFRCSRTSIWKVLACAIVWYHRDRGVHPSGYCQSPSVRLFAYRESQFPGGPLVISKPGFYITRIANSENSSGGLSEGETH